MAEEENHSRTEDKPTSGADRQTVEQVLTEFENYKAKTKEWQVKVRERDTKLREQLKSSTTTIQSQQEEINSLLKTVNQLEDEASAVRVMKQKLDESEERTKQAVKEAREVLIKKQELELEEKQNQMNKLRSRITQLDQHAEQLQKIIDGTHWFFTASADSSTASKQTKSRSKVPSILHRCVVRAPSSDGSHLTTNYCCLGHQDDCHEAHPAVCWMNEEHMLTSWKKAFGSDLPILPPLEEDKAQVNMASAVQETEVKVKGQLDQEHKEKLLALRTEMEEKERSLQSKHLTVVENYQSQIQELQGQVHFLRQQELDREKESRETTELLTLELEGKHQEELQQMQLDYQAKFTPLEVKVKELESYKAKAQLALKRKESHQADESRAVNTHTVTPSSCRDVAVQAVISTSDDRGQREKAEVDDGHNEYQQKVRNDENAEKIAYLNRALLESQLESQRLQVTHHEALQELINKNKQLEKELQTQRESYFALGEKHVDDIIRERVVELQRLNEEIESLQSLQAKLATAPSSSSSSIVEQAKATTTQLRKSVPHVETGTQTSSLLFSSATAAQEAMNNYSEEVHHDGSSKDPKDVRKEAAAHDGEFDFNEFLHTNEVSITTSQLQATLAKKNQMLMLLQREHSEAQRQLEQLRYEVREYSLTEERHLEQEQCLKEQLREAEREQQRQQTVSSQGDYIKNILVKYICSKNNVAVQRSLLPVIYTLLQCSKEEQAAIDKAVH